MEVAAIRRELDALKEVIAPLNQRIEELERRLDGAENVFSLCCFFLRLVSVSRLICLSIAVFSRGEVGNACRRGNR